VLDTESSIAKIPRLEVEHQVLLQLLSDGFGDLRTFNNITETTHPLQFFRKPCSMEFDTTVGELSQLMTVLAFSESSADAMF
jgi:hypothetical protein